MERAAAAEARAEPDVPSVGDDTGEQAESRPVEISAEERMQQERRDLGLARRRSPRVHAALLLIPPIAATACHAAFIGLLLCKWLALEVAHDGPIAYGSFGAMHTGRGVGPSWQFVFVPSWLKEILQILFSGAALSVGPGLTDPLFRNTRIHCIESIAQAMLCMLFQLLLCVRLMNEGGSWALVFLPWYVGAALHMFFYLKKRPDVRHGGRRPGFPVSLAHVLAIVISLKLSGMFDEVVDVTSTSGLIASANASMADALTVNASSNHSAAGAVAVIVTSMTQRAGTSWGSLLWPLWVLAAGAGVVLSSIACCALPMLIWRRGDQTRLQAASLLGTLVLVIGGAFIPALTSAINLTRWLDGDGTIGCIFILVPYLIACCVFVVLLFCSLLMILLMPRSGRPHLVAAGEHGEGANDDDVPDMFAHLPPPVALIRESSTLFRRVSTTTLESYCERRGRQHASGSGSISSTAAELCSSTTLLDDGTRSNASSSAEDLVGMPAILEDGYARGDDEAPRCPPVAELAEIELSALSSVHAVADATRAPGAASPPASAAVAVEDEDDEGGLENEFCWICCHGPRDAVLLECGHGGICMDCAERCKQRRPPVCPMCRQRISRIVKLSGSTETVDGEVVVHVGTD